MVAITIIVNVIGAMFIAFYFEYDPQIRLFHADLIEIAAGIGVILDPIGALIFLTIQIWYERPFRKWLNNHFEGVSSPSDLTVKARRRLLNEVFVLIGLDLFMWLIGSAIYTIAFRIHGAPDELVFRTIYIPLAAAFLVVILTFYFMDFVLQRFMIPIFFPQGGLYTTPGVLRIRIRMRMAAMVWAINLIPMLTFIFLPRRVSYLFPGDPAAAFESLRVAMMYHSVFFICIAGTMAFFLSKNLIRPILEISRVVRGVNEGDLSMRVKVTSNDEIGFAGDILNEMTHGLRERRRLQDSLDLAMEVQQHLLPRKSPVIAGLDIAGRSIYCDETGGDYYDYIVRGEEGEERSAVVIGDVSDHGIPSALLMATARALIRRSCSDTASVGEVLGDVNGHLAQAVEDSGQFMTLFLLEIDRESGTASWSNAGHEPALVYNAASKSYIELGGKGPALAVVDEYEYPESSRDLTPGEIIILCTDGVWEAAGPDGVMFGRSGIKNVVRAHAWMSAAEIVDSIISELQRFVHPLPFNDDVTLVVIKVLDNRKKQGLVRHRVTSKKHC